MDGTNWGAIVFSFSFAYEGCIPNINVLLCVELAKKFVVGGWVSGWVVVCKAIIVLSLA